VVIEYTILVWGKNKKILKSGHHSLPRQLQVNLMYTVKSCLRKKKKKKKDTIEMIYEQNKSMEDKL
jgi:hypothetical protein